MIGLVMVLRGHTFYRLLTRPDLVCGYTIVKSNVLWYEHALDHSGDRSEIQTQLQG